MPPSLTIRETGRQRVYSELSKDKSGRARIPTQCCLTKEAFTISLPLCKKSRKAIRLMSNPY
jgi:hypothetical protein